MHLNGIPRSVSWENVLTRKVKRVMKLTTIFLIVTCLQVSASTNAQSITMSVKNKPLEKVLSELRKQSGFRFIYGKELISKAQPVTIMAKDEPFTEVLDRIFRDQQLNYKIADNYIVISARPQPLPQKDKASEAPDPGNVSGKITDEEGHPLEGATVQLKGTRNGTSTNAKGEFVIKANPGDVLIISYLGFQTKEIVVDAQSTVKVSMVAAIQTNNEVVVIGYGTTRKADLTGAVSTVKVSDMAKMPVARLDQALQGQVPGAQILQNNGAPGSPISFFIRGAGTIGNTDPLFVVDGVPTKININTLNMADVESISVLKDASAAAMYGSRAANGVVLIVTKSGKTGKTKIDFDAYYGLQQAWKKLDLLNATQWATVRNAALKNDNLPPDWGNVDTLGAGTNWQNAVFRTAPIQSYNLSASGGNDKTSYFLSAGNFQQKGIVRYSGYERNTLRANVSSTPGARLRLGNNFTFSDIKSDVVPTEVAGVLKNAILALPIIPVYRGNRYAGPSTPKEGTGANPLAQAANANSTDVLRRLTNSMFAEYELLKHLKLKSSLGLDVVTQEQKSFSPTFAYDNYINTVSGLSQYNSNSMDWVWENTATYKNSFKNKHFLTVLLGTSAENFKKNYTYITKTGFPGNDPNLQYPDNGSIVQASGVQGNTEEWSLLSYFGRLDYNFRDKYIFSANVRVDGSSRFGAANRYGTFPSFAAGWNIREEKFMQNAHFIDHLKLRASWGQLGNQEIGLYSFTSTLSPYYTTFGQTPAAAPGYAPASPPNPAVKWETTTQTDIGLELSVLDSRLAFEVDYYTKKTNDMLLTLPTPLSSGYPNTSFTNAGSVKNTGVEFSATYRKSTGDFNYSVSANFSAYKNEVISLGPLNQPVVNNLFFDFATSSNVGYPMYQFYGYEAEGLFQSQDEITKHATQTGAKPGDVKFRDINNDGVIDAKDRTFIGNPFPKFTYGLNANFSYRNFDCFIQLQGAQGNKVYNAARFWGMNIGETVNYSTDVLKSWNGEGSSNEIPRLTTQDPNNNKRASTRFVEDGSYMRIKNVQIGYTMPEKILNKIKLRSLRVYMGANNLLTFTKYSGFDPEVGQAFTSTTNAAGTTPNLGSSNFVRGSLGFDQVSFPQARTFTFGLQLGIQ
ncbi:TonB-linked outer membrane protein, SusC/RagA family [Chitinophaga ginsengisegetis]|uniref:TonB-linked outer membrane protein, SusC/RagA family n=1 Tax=Chitinophaga ginsengisegetis TaxID=393003 RepID=A0A1T5NKE2_9BACT|nr:TonB-linked outer membrane protein, SusC/RagA family [Chitinophaga ginsengisegetis]